MEDAERDTRVVGTMCGMCTTCCGVDVSVERGKVVAVNGTKGHFLGTPCIKGSRGMIEWQYSEQRLKAPMKKTTGGRWVEIPWDEAIGAIAERLGRLKEKSGARSLAVHVGIPFIDTHVEKVIRRFCDLYGSPNYTSGSSFCNMARRIGTGLTFNHRGIFPIASYAGARCVILWGSNPPHTISPKISAAISHMKEAGSKIIVVNPRTIEIAKKADLHARLRPGTDLALALGLLNVIITEKLYDEEFVEKWTTGFDRLVAHIEQYPPERIEEITWVPAAQIREIARAYARSSPGAIHEGISLDHSTNGIQAIRAISLLIAITGNFDVPGGNTYALPLNWSDLRLKEKLGRDLPVDEGKYPLFNRFVQDEVHALPILSGILEKRPYPIQALIVVGSNPLLTWPNSNRVEQALKGLDLLVCVDLFMTETAKCADIALPATTFLERDDIHMYLGIPAIQVRRKAVNPPAGCMDDWRIWTALGKKMGYGEYFPWESADALFEEILKPTPLRLQDVKESRRGLFYEEKSEPRRYLREGFDTPSGKAEIYSETMRELGYDPLPAYLEPAESPLSRPDLADRYPLILTTGARNPVFTHSQFRDVPSLRRHTPEPLAEIHPATAARHGIGDADWVEVESVRGRAAFKARITPDILEKVISLPHGWPAASNANCLTDDDARDPISGYPGFRSSLCRVSRLNR